MQAVAYVEEAHEFGSDRPKPAPGVIQVIDRDGVPYAVDFLCPCGCGSPLFAPVVRPGEPQGLHEWCFSRGPNGVTLSPSFRVLGRCKAHFNITDGGAVMHGDSGA